MTTPSKRLIAAVSVAALLGATAASPALADGRRGHYGGHHRGHGGNAGAYVALGFGALALGALAYSASRPVYYAPPAYYYPPPAPPPYPYYYYGPPAGYVYDPYANAWVPDPQFDRPSN
jgi:hypothetical protein